LAFFTTSAVRLPEPTRKADIETAGASNVDFVVKRFSLKKSMNGGLSVGNKIILCPFF
jgi:hypothetical protein